MYVATVLRKQKKKEYMRKIYNWKEKKARESYRESFGKFSLYIVIEWKYLYKEPELYAETEKQIFKLYAKLVMIGQKQIDPLW